MLLMVRVISLILLVMLCGLSSNAFGAMRECRSVSPGESKQERREAIRNCFDLIRESIHDFVERQAEFDRNMEDISERNKRMKTILEEVLEESRRRKRP